MSAIEPVGWVFHPSVLVGVCLWTLLYEAVRRPLRARNRWGKAPGTAPRLAFHAGSMVLLLALISPLDAIGDEYLFSAHMGQHLLFLFVVAPLWMAGIPAWLPAQILRGNALRAARWMTQPLAAALIFAAVTLVWHHPGLYGMAQTHEALHIAEHLAFIGAGLVGWWPLVGPETPALPKPSVPVRLLYGFAIALPCTLLGALFTFSDTPIYTFYAAAAHPFGIGALEDQRWGGLLMWVPTHMLVLAVVGKIAATWLEGGPQQTWARQSLHH